MDTTRTSIRKPVHREGAEKYLLITLLSFAASLSFTRLFLEITGYPQIGNATLHIAHVLWGGLLLYIAALLPLLLANRWVYLLVSILSGVGIGLFIDEVGKFITQTNDYFFPPAAPIIYAFFLLLVMLYQRIRHRPRTGDARAELYSVLDSLEEALDHDLSDRERANIIYRLDRISAETLSPDIVRLIEGIRHFVAYEQLTLTPEVPGPIEQIKLRLKTWEERWITPRSFRYILVGGMVAMGAWVLYYPLLILYQSANPNQFELIVRELIQARLINSRTGLNWFEARLALQSVVGIIMLISAFYLGIGRTRYGAALGYLGLLLSLTTVNLLMFYFDQFSTIISTAIQFCLLLAIMHYRSRYII